MSVADLKKYSQMCQEDQTVRQQAKEIGMVNLEGQIAYAKELGLQFNKDDVQTLADEAGVTKGELSEEQLEQIAGGCATLTAVVIAGVCCGALGVVAGVSVGASSKTW
jgi:predicted ribosomally synthesized peptide with nif11-like leader